MKLVSVAEMTAIENEAESKGLTIPQLMENAGRGLAEAVGDLQVEAPGREIFGLVGPGNNGGDTLVALSYLAADGWRAHAYLIKRTPDALVERLEKAGGKIVLGNEDDGFTGLADCIETAAVLLDGVLGTGTRPPLKGEAATVLAAVRRMLEDSDDPPYVVAVDCPSGVNCDTGESAEECIPADLTVTMAAVKRGLLRMPAHEFVGGLRVVDIGLPPDLPALMSVRTEVADEDTVAAILPKRPLDAHKGTFGTALIAAGSVNYTGAAWLAGEAAYRAGAGLVTLAVPSVLHAALAGNFPEATWLLLPHEMGVIAPGAADVLARGFDRATALLVGPGLGTEAETGEFIARLVSVAEAVEKPTARIGFLGAQMSQVPGAGRKWPAAVFDADGLKLLASIKNWHKLLPAPAVLTPHPGEMAVLTGLAKDQIQQDRESVARKYATDWGHVVVLKGAFTVVAAPDGRITVIPVASAALARAGTGDVLAGLIVGLEAQGVNPFDAAVAGGWVHAQAGLYAAQKLGTNTSVLARDVLASVADVIADLRPD
jgi:NAD(P)H-hydrate epimerase